MNFNDQVQEKYTDAYKNKAEKIISLNGENILIPPTKEFQPITKNIQNDFLCYSISTENKVYQFGFEMHDDYDIIFDIYGKIIDSFIVKLEYSNNTKIKTLPLFTYIHSDVMPLFYCNEMTIYFTNGYLVARTKAKYKNKRINPVGSCVGLDKNSPIFNLVKVNTETLKSESL